MKEHFEKYTIQNIFVFPRQPSHPENLRCNASWNFSFVWYINGRPNHQIISMIIRTKLEGLHLNFWTFSSLTWPLDVCLITLVKVSFCSFTLTKVWQFYCQMFFTRRRSFRHIGTETQTCTWWNRGSNVCYEGGGISKYWRRQCGWNWGELGKNMCGLQKCVQKQETNYVSLANNEPTHDGMQDGEIILQLFANFQMLCLYCATINNFLGHTYNVCPWRCSNVVQWIVLGFVLIWTHFLNNLLLMLMISNRRMRMGRGKGNRKTIRTKAAINMVRGENLWGWV